MSQAIELINTEGKNENDVLALASIIKEQGLSTDLDHWRYKWNEEGRLAELLLGICGLKGSLSLEGLDALTYLECPSNQLESIDVSGNPALKELSCFNNQLKSLDVSNNPALKILDCSRNSLAVLDISRNPALEQMYCADNGLTGLDISQNPELKDLYCSKNPLDELDTSRNPKLKKLCCDDRVEIQNTAAVEDHTSDIEME